MIKVSRGTLAVGPYMMASGSGGGGDGPPKGPKVVSKPPRGPGWLARFIAWAKAKFGL